MQFSGSEMEDRVQRLRAELRARRLDALLIDDCEATAYYFNYESSVALYRAGLIPVDGESFFVLRWVDVAPLQE
ncbi:aminopeptidase P family N-terminal domain-containing protein, partial [Mesorhizobium sp. M0092]